MNWERGESVGERGRDGRGREKEFGRWKGIERQSQGEGVGELNEGQGWGAGDVRVKRERERGERREEGR